MKHSILTLFIIPFLLGISTSETNKNQESENNIVVLELFTSQGCSSCPSADKLLNQIKDNNVISLSYHVDYWNYIGWKDPFSKADYSDRQRRYASKFFSSSIYTPQLVVNGKEHFVGSDRGLLKQKISQYSRAKSSHILSVSDAAKNNGMVNFNYQITGNINNKSIRVVLVINERKTLVKRGENRNRELINNNIVVAEQEALLNAMKGKGSIRIPEIVESTDDLSLIVIIENDNQDIMTGSKVKL